MPRLDDPAEWKIVREMYFDTSTPNDEDTEERYDRMDSRIKNNQSKR